MRKVPTVFWLASAAFLACAAPAAAEPAPKPETAVGLSSDMSVEALEAVLAELDSPDADARKRALAKVEGLGPESVTAIGKKLADLRKVPSAPVTAAVKVAREGAKDADLADVLVKSKLDGGSKTAFVTASLLRALAHVGTTPALRQLVKVAGDHGGAFRPDIARHIKNLGDKATPALIETKKDATTEVRHWAYAQLEANGKRLPGDAVQTKDNQILAEVLRAYGAVHDLDAVPVILSFVNADRAPVRNAARDAILSFDKDAIWKLREAYQNVTNKQAQEGWSAAEVAKELFAAYDRLRLTEVYGLLEEGLKAEREGRLDEAIASFDKVLARQPMLDRRGEMVPAYVAHAQKIEASDPPAARAEFEKALRLANDGPRASQIKAELAYLEGNDLAARGIADREPYERALTLDPAHLGARSALARMDEKAEARKVKVRGGAAAITFVLVAIVGLVLFAGRRRPRAATS